MKASEASDRRKQPTQREYRRMTKEEAHALLTSGSRGIGSTFQFVGRDRKVRNARTSGMLKTWKDGRWRIPVKFGLYESSALVPYASDPNFAAFEGSESFDVPMPCVETQASAHRSEDAK